MEFVFVCSNPDTKLQRESACLAKFVSLGEHIKSLRSSMNWCLLCSVVSVRPLEPLFIKIHTIYEWPFEKGNLGHIGIYRIFKKSRENLLCGWSCSIASLYSARHINKAFLKYLIQQHKLQETPFLRPLKISLFKRKMRVWMWIDY